MTSFLNWISWKIMCVNRVTFLASKICLLILIDNRHSTSNYNDFYWRGNWKFYLFTKNVFFAFWLEAVLFEKVKCKFKSNQLFWQAFANMWLCTTAFHYLDWNQISNSSLDSVYYSYFQLVVRRVIIASKMISCCIDARAALVCNYRLWARVS